ncbi:hypothetical protein JCM8097_002433 [Rhodosporidiobolus ruineniae]
MPVLSPAAALLASGGFSAAYLGSLYVLPSTRVSLSPPPPPPAPPAEDLASSIPANDRKKQQQPPRDRNHPSVIKARLTAVSLASAASCAFVPLLVSPAASSSLEGYRAALPTALKLLGFVLPSSPAQTARLLLYPLGLTASLFAGSFYVHYLTHDLPWQRNWTSTPLGWFGELKSKFMGWIGVRNFVLAPLTEELTFRSCVIAASVLGGYSKSQLVFLTPLWFGLAHVHHAFDTWRAGGRTKQALIRGVLQSTFQFLYTTIFGWYSAFLFLRTGSILPPFLAHALCNTLGLPPIMWALHAFPEKKLSIWGSYVAGIGAFSYGFWRWTEPALFGGSAFWPQ